MNRAAATIIMPVGWRGTGVLAVLVLCAALPCAALTQSEKPRPNKCLMVIGAHADDVEQIAGGVMVKYKAEGYELIYVGTSNNAAGCILNRSLPSSKTTFVEKPVPHDYPADALETIEIRTKEARDAAAILGAKPIFLNFWETEFWPAVREVIYVGDEFFQQYDPPGRNVISVATRFSDTVSVVADLLKEYRPEIVITHMTGGEKHDHGNTGYMVYLAFKEAMESGAVGQLWMRPRGWVQDPPWEDRLAPYIVTIDVTPYIERCYQALNAHVSQKGTGMFIVELGKKYEESFLVILDAYKNTSAESRPKADY